MSILILSFYREKPKDEDRKSNTLNSCKTINNYYNYIIVGVSQMRDVDFPLDDYFMALAILATTRSESPNPVWQAYNEILHMCCASPLKILCQCLFSQVGACVVLENPRRAISVGYNGLPDARKNSSGKQDTSYGMTYQQ